MTMASAVSSSYGTPLALIAINSSPGTRAERFPLVQATRPFLASSWWSAASSRRSSSMHEVLGSAQLVHHRAVGEVVVQRAIVGVQGVGNCRALGVRPL